MFRLIHDWIYQCELPSRSATSKNNSGRSWTQIGKSDIPADPKHNLPHIFIHCFNDILGITLNWISLYRLKASFHGIWHSSSVVFSSKEKRKRLFIITTKKLCLNVHFLILVSTCLISLTKILSLDLVPYAFIEGVQNIRYSFFMRISIFPSSILTHSVSKCHYVISFNQTILQMQFDKW